MRFSEFIQLNEIGPPPGLGMGMGAPTPGGAMGGLPPPGMGGMGGAGMPPPMGGPPPMPGAPPMGGAPGAPQTPATEIKTKDVWSLLEKLLSGQPPADNKDSEEGKKPSKILRSV